MLNVQKFLIDLRFHSSEPMTVAESSARLKEEHGVNVKLYPEDQLIVLNYDQINSPKNAITNECRGLILDYNFLVVCRPFDRFFNYGEQPETQKHIDMSRAVIYPKVDGSLIKIYHHNDKWHIATRGTAFAESSVGDFKITFEQLVLKALGMLDMNVFNSQCNTALNKDVTYLAEVTALENRVVTRYEDYKLHYLAARSKTGEYLLGEASWFKTIGGDISSYLNAWKFNTMEEVVNAAKSLPNLQEGYVLYQDGIPVCKIKSPAYVALHHIKSNISSEKNLIKLALSGEQDEVCMHFPEFTEFFVKYNEAWKDVKAICEKTYEDIKGIDSQKDFAIAATTKLKWLSSILFSARKLNTTTKDVLNGLGEDRKVTIIQEYFNENT